MRLHTREGFWVGCTDTVKESALKVDSGKKIPCRTGEPNLRHQRDVLNQLSYMQSLYLQGCLPTVQFVSILQGKTTQIQKCKVLLIRTMRNHFCQNTICFEQFIILHAAQASDLCFPSYFPPSCFLKLLRVTGHRYFYPGKMSEGKRKKEVQGRHRDSCSCSQYIRQTTSFCHRQKAENAFCSPCTCCTCRPMSSATCMAGTCMCDLRMAAHAGRDDIAWCMKLSRGKY